MTLLLMIVIPAAVYVAGAGLGRHHGRRSSRNIAAMNKALIDHCKEISRGL